MLVESIAFIAAIFVIAGAILGGLALVCWHTRPPDTQEAAALQLEIRPLRRAPMAEG
jgi:hypothetical protein